MNSIYTRLPGVRRTLIGNDTLWMANDHLLAVHSNRISEDYQRLYFKDIQALIVEEPDYSQRKIVLGGLVAVLAIALLALGSSRHYISAFFVLLLLPIPFSMLASMAQCRCYAVTALGRYKLGSLKRNDSLQGALAILTPLIMEAQKKEETTAVPGPSEVL
jgi:hypothetical protein